MEEEDKPGSDSRPWLLCNNDFMPSGFDDNVAASCHGCQTALYHRPHTPKGCVPICFECFCDLIEMDKQPELKITPETREELRKLLHPGK